MKTPTAVVQLFISLYPLLHAKVYAQDKNVWFSRSSARSWPFFQISTSTGKYTGYLGISGVRTRPAPALPPPPASVPCCAAPCRYHARVRTARSIQEDEGDRSSSSLPRVSNTAFPCSTGKMPRPIFRFVDFCPDNKTVTIVYPQRAEGYEADPMCGGVQNCLLALLNEVQRPSREERSYRSSRWSRRKPGIPDLLVALNPKDLSSECERPPFGGGTLPRGQETLKALGLE